MCDMPRLQDTITLVPIPRDLVDDVVNALLDAFEALPFTDGALDADRDFVGDVRLVEGEHLTAGARYSFVPPDLAAKAPVDKAAADKAPTYELKVASWDRTGEMCVDIRTNVDGHIVDTRVNLRMDGRRLRILHVTGNYQGPGPFRFLRRAKWEVEARLDEWWASLPSQTAPVSARLMHPLAQASLATQRGRNKDELWTVRNTFLLRGRGIARPFAALGLPFVRKRLHNFVRQVLNTVQTTWNNAVPAMVERGMQERVTLHNQVAIKSISREWSEGYVAALHRSIGELRFEKGRLTTRTPNASPAEVRLLEGEHIRPGARYRLVLDETETGPADSVDLNVVAWDPGGPNRIEFGDPDGTRTGWFEVDSAEKPAVFRAAFTGRAADSTELVLTAEANLEDWWASVADSDASRPAVKVTARHPLAEAALTLTPSPPSNPEEEKRDQPERPADDDRWPTHVSVTIEGRQWTRPLVAVAGLVVADALTDWLGNLAAQAAALWDDAVSPTEGTEPAAAAERTVHHLFFTPDA